MDDTMLQAVINSQNSQVPAVLATIIRTQGSTPRGPGTQMLVRADGQIAGTVGGGTAEKSIIQKAQALLTTGGQAAAEIYSLTLPQATPVTKLPVCGANIEVILEPLPESAFWQFAQDLLLSGKNAAIATSLFPPYPKRLLDSEGKVLLGPTPTPTPMPTPSEFLFPAAKLQEMISRREAEVIGSEGDGKGNSPETSRWFVEPLLRTERLLILGAGHVAREVAFHAQSLDFQVTVIDDREAFALPEFFPAAQTVICSDFVPGIKSYQPGRDSYIVITTWSHQKDAECATEALKYEAKYIGMLGSNKKLASIVNNLQKAGYTSENIARLKSPVGLPIGAQTPAEIAISILAEIISVRRTA